jgi:hypothetical protein
MKDDQRAIFIATAVGHAGAGRCIGDLSFNDDIAAAGNSTMVPTERCNWRRALSHCRLGTIGAAQDRAAILEMRRSG